MTTEEAIQRGNNLVGVAVAGLAGVTFFPEFFLETEGPYKLDEVILLLIGLAGVAWYLMGRNQQHRSLVPLVLVGTDLIVKIIGLAIELGDKEDVGDEYSALILFVLATLLVGWLYLTSRGAAQSSGS